MTISPAELAYRALDAAPDAMVLVDESGIIRFANRQVMALFGYAPEGVSGKSIGQLVAPCCGGGSLTHGAQGLGEWDGRLMGPHGGLMGRREDGTEFPVEMSFRPIGDADGIHVAVIRNVAERKRMDMAIAAARDGADRGNLGKSRLLATASHDLRQPVQTLALLNGILRRTVAEPDATDALDQQEQVIAAMSRLVNALLDISKLESGVIKPEQTDFAVAVVFNDLRREFTSLAASKGITLQAEACTDWVHSDPSLVEQILRNLIANAIKYTRQGGVRLRCRHAQALVRIEVLDTGVGIPPDQLGSIFDEFYQVGVARNTCRDGFGLGLSIVQRLVRLLDLSLEVRSEVGKGSAFSLELPSGVPQAASLCVAVPQRAAPGRGTERPRVLLVEDDSGVREATRLLLKGTSINRPSRVS
jgi:PAS domain S-box-containing protein